MALNIAIHNPTALKNGALGNAAQLDAGANGIVVALGAQSPQITGPALLIFTADEDQRISVVTSGAYAAPAATAIKLKANVPTPYIVSRGSIYVNVAKDATQTSMVPFMDPAGEAIDQITSLRAYFSDDFGGAALDATKWDVYDGGLPAVTLSTGAQTAIGSQVTGIGHSVGSSALSVTMGTTNNAEKWFLSKAMFCGTEDILIVLSKSQAIAANMIQIGLVEVDFATGYPIQNSTLTTEFTNKAAVEFGQTTTNTTAFLKTIADNSPSETSVTGSPFSQTAMTSSFETLLQIRAEDIHAQSATVDNAGSKTANTIRVSSQVPNDTRVYKLLMRFKNVSAPGSGTTVTVSRVLVQDHQAVNVSITEAAGGQTGSQGLPVNLANGLPAGTNNIGSTINYVGFTESSSTLGAGATFTGTGHATSGAPGNYANYYNAQAYADVTGTLYIDMSTDSGGSYQEVASQATVAGTVGFRAALSVKMCAPTGSALLFRTRFVNGAGAQATFRCNSSFSQN